MPRRNRPPKRKVIPDARYNSVLLSQFVNKLMQKGKRSLATRIMYDTIEMAGEKLKKQPLEVLEQAVVVRHPAGVGDRLRAEDQQAVFFLDLLENKIPVQIGGVVEVVRHGSRLLEMIEGLHLRPLCFF